MKLIKLSILPVVTIILIATYISNYTPLESYSPMDSYVKGVNDSHAATVKAEQDAKRFIDSINLK